MPLRNKLKPLALLSIIACGLPARSAQAGPLIDWLFGHKRQPAPAYAVGYPYAVGMPVVSGYAPVVAPYAASMPVLPSYTTGYTPGIGYSALRPSVGAIAPAAVIPAPTTPITLVPDYRTSVSRTPVTYYRPLLTTDATTGSQVVAMAPCSSYEYQTQRVPTWGLTQLYNGGATLPTTTALSPVTSPTVVLPRGGVALAGPAVGTQPYGTAYGTYPQATTMIAPSAPTVSAIAPSVPAYATTPYSAGYSAYESNPANYSALQPAIGTAPAATYPTVPSGGSTGSTGTAYYGGSTGSTGTEYYGSSSAGGGSTGSYIAPAQPMTQIPGAAPYPQAPYGTTPGVTPTQPAYPGSGPVLPPSGVPSSDPAASQPPVLPLQGTGAQLNSKPQLQSVVQQPVPGVRSTASTPSTAPARDSQPRGSDNRGPGLLPIPVPDDFQHEPRWNPGLLNEQDQTAANTTDSQSQVVSAAAEDPAVAWGSKTIHWASFKEPVDTRPAAVSSSAGLELSAPQSRFRDVTGGNAAAAVRAAENAIVQPRASGNDQRSAQVVVPSHVQMVPLEESVQQSPVVPSAAPRSASGDHLMLSPSTGGIQIGPAADASAAQSPQPSAAGVTAPAANRSRYRTDGWQRAQ